MAAPRSLKKVMTMLGEVKMAELPQQMLKKGIKRLREAAVMDMLPEAGRPLREVH